MDLWVRRLKPTEESLLTSEKGDEYLEGHTRSYNSDSTLKYY